MTHPVNGFELSFTARRSWKAKRVLHGKRIDIVPVTWGHARRQAGKEVFQEVWFRDREENTRMNATKEPFVVAIAVAKDPSDPEKEFSKFTNLFEVEATGRLLSDQSIETRVIRRVTASDH